MLKLRHFIVIAVLFLVVIVLLAFLGGASADNLDERKAIAIAEAVLREVPGSHAGLILEPERNLATTIHVDASVSMGGYAFTNTAFVKLVDYLSRQWSARLRAAGTDFPPGKDTVDDPRFFAKQENYRAGHDMAATIRLITRDTGRMHLLVTDGQPWDSGDKPAYVEVATAINEFLGQGGRCVLLLYRSAYRGYYPSPLLTNEVRKSVFYECPDRPLAVWVFAHQGCALSRVVADLASSPTDLRFATKLQFGLPDFSLALAGRTLGGEPNQPKLGREIGSLKDVLTGKEIDRIKDYQLIRIRPKSVNSDGYVPLQFDLATTTGMAPEKGWDSLTNSLSVTLDCWEIHEESVLDTPLVKKAGTGSTNAVAGAKPALSVAPAKANPQGSRIRLEMLKHHELQYTLRSMAGSTSTNAPGTPSAGPAKARLVVEVPRPASKAKRFAWVLTLQPKYAGSSLQLPQGYSTPDDRSPDQCDKILKLEEMLNIVAAHTEKRGTVLFLTDFPK